MPTCLSFISCCKVVFMVKMFPKPELVIMNAQTLKLKCGHMTSENKVFLYLNLTLNTSLFNDRDVLNPLASVTAPVECCDHGC